MEIRHHQPWLAPHRQSTTRIDITNEHPNADSLPDWAR
jgi:hypothetical protein